MEQFKNNGMIPKKVTKAYVIESNKGRPVKICDTTYGGIKSIRVMSIEEATRLGFLNEPVVNDEESSELKPQEYDHAINFTIPKP